MQIRREARVGVTLGPLGLLALRASAVAIRGDAPERGRDDPGEQEAEELIGELHDEHDEDSDEVTASDGPEAFASVPTQLVSGRLITWYGPAMLEAATLWMNQPGSRAGRPY